MNLNKKKISLLIGGVLITIAIIGGFCLNNTFFYQHRLKKNTLVIERTKRPFKLFEKIYYQWCYPFKTQPMEGDVLHFRRTTIVNGDIPEMENPLHSPEITALLEMEEKGEYLSEKQEEQLRQGLEKATNKLREQILATPTKTVKLANLNIPVLTSHLMLKQFPPEKALTIPEKGELSNSFDLYTVFCTISLAEKIHGKGYYSEELINQYLDLIEKDKIASTLLKNNLQNLPPSIQDIMTQHGNLEAE